MQRFTYDAESSALYIYINEGAEFARTETVLDGDVLINIDIDVDDEIIGVEILA